MKRLYEVLVPTIYFDTNKPIRTKHHRNFDLFVRKLSNGLTIMRPAKGQWVHEGKLFEERVIPVRIYCSESDIKKIVAFSLTHYRQKAIMHYLISSECQITYAK